MKQIRKLLCFVLVTLSVTSIASAATDYTFETDDTPEYYPSTSYEEIYGSLYNYGGPNIVDYQTTRSRNWSMGPSQQRRRGSWKKLCFPGCRPASARHPAADMVFREGPMVFPKASPRYRNCRRCSRTSRISNISLPPIPAWRGWSVKTAA